jgi:uncharacterized protein YdhG (YjbR/CyaY superfamily)
MAKADFKTVDEYIASFPSDVKRTLNTVAPYEITKSAIRFPLDQPVPTKLIADIAKFRAKEAFERAKATKSLKK